jgi:hypothetical protein
MSFPVSARVAAARLHDTRQQRAEYRDIVVSTVAVVAIVFLVPTLGILLWILKGGL